MSNSSRGGRKPAVFPPVEKALTYRRDIDGLRALAVLPVLFFHADLGGFGGGFVGVDIFFVISGYLITSIIVGALEKDSFSIGWFYERRIRRIIPALVVMIAVTAVASIIFLPPRDLAQFGLSASATAAFVSNFYFSQHTGYFDAPETMMPLLHTWSLGVEEQFYIVWPLILLACHRMGIRGIKVLVVSFAVASLTYSAVSIMTVHGARASFYLPQARAWELMMGAMLSLGLVPTIMPRWLQETLALLGVSMITFAVTQFSAATAFPGLWALVPCLGAALVIQTGHTGQTAVSKLLSHSSLVFVGLISYSLYLWHWPIFILAENYLGREFNVGEAVTLIVASMLVATASWRYVEQPFRQRGGNSFFSRKACLAGGFSALTLVAFLGNTLFREGGLPGRLGPAAQRFDAASQEDNPLHGQCHGRATPQPALGCTKPALNADGGYDIIVWGDSVADAFFPGLLTVAENYGLSIRQATASACLPIIGANRVDFKKRGRGSAHKCERYGQALLSELAAGPRPRVAILTGRWSMYTAGSEPSAFLVDVEQQTLDVATSRAVLSRALDKTVDALNALGISVVLFGQLPEFIDDPNRCFLRRSMYGGSADECLKLPRTIADERLKASNKILADSTKGRPRTHYLALEPLLCDAQTCWAAREDQPLYRDVDHLSLTGARLVGAALLQSATLAPLLAPAVR